MVDLILILMPSHLALSPYSVCSHNRESKDSTLSPMLILKSDSSLAVGRFLSCDRIENVVE